MLAWLHKEQSTSTSVGDAEDNEEDDDNELDQDELMNWKQA